jgi:flagellar biosynthesis component FlhA
MKDPVRTGLPGNSAGCTLLSPTAEYEREVFRSINYTGREPVLSMEAEVLQRALAGVRETASNVTGSAAVVVNNPAIRPFVRAFLGVEFPYLDVLSRRELAPGMDVKAARAIPLPSA